MNRERDDSVKNAEERRTSPPSSTYENNYPLKAKYDLEDCLNGAQERKEVNKSHSTVLDDDDSDNDDYEEFPDSHYLTFRLKSYVMMGILPTSMLKRRETLSVTVKMEKGSTEFTTIP